MYEAYCSAMRDRSIQEYAEAAPPAGGAAIEAQAAGGEGAGGSAAAADKAAAEARQGKPRGWKGWGAHKVQSMRRKMSDKRRGGADVALPPGEGASAPPSPGKAPQGER